MKNIWIKIPQNYRDHIVSVIKTFVAGFVFFIMSQISTSGTVDFSMDAIKGLLLAALRFAIVQLAIAFKPSEPKEFTVPPQP